MKLFCSKCQKVFEAEKPSDSSSVKCPLCGGEQEYPPTVPGPGVVVGDFLIEKLLSRGGMGEVFLAKQISLDRPVALKVLQQKHLEDKEYVDSLFKEARAAAKLSHPNIVQAYAVGEENGIFYFAMEYIRGETFKQILQREKTIEFTRAATVIRDIARALGAAWKEQKLVHQDIKPDNIMLDANGFAKLSDLGLAKVANGAPDESEDDDQVLGTPQYISPEQLTGVPTDIRSDIYSLGATFYHFVTGRFPYVGKTGDEIARMHIESVLQPPKEVNPALPDELNRIIVKMMEKDINKRYQSAESLIEDIDAYLRSAQPAAKKSVKPAAVIPAAKPAVPPKPMIPKLSVPGKSVAKPTVPAEASATVPQAAPPSVPPSVPPPADDQPVEPESSGEGEWPEDKPKSVLILKIVLVSVASLVLLAVILLAGLVICHKTRTALPGELDSFARTVAGWFGMALSEEPPQNGGTVRPKIGAPAQAGKKSGKTVISDNSAKYDRITALPVGGRERRAEFLRQAGALLSQGEPTAAAERKAYWRLREKFAAIDEEMRFKSFRAERKKVNDGIIAERKREEEERRRLRERREREEREYREQMERRERRIAEEEARRRREEAKRKKQLEDAAFDNLKNEVDKAMKILTEGFFAEAEGNDGALAKALTRSEDIYLRDGENARERKLLGDYREIRRQLPAEAKKLREFRNAMRNIKNDIPCAIPGEGMCLVVALYPDGSADVVQRSRRRHIPAEQLARSRNFKKSFVENLKDKNPNVLFYYALMTRRFDPEAMKNAPPFWKKHIGLFLPAAQAR